MEAEKCAFRTTRGKDVRGAEAFYKGKEGLAFLSH